MGSRCQIILYSSSESEAAHAAKEAFEVVADIENALSDYRSDSESMMATAHGANQWVPISHTLTHVLKRCEELHTLSCGAFDPTVGAYTHLWRDAKRNGTVPTTTQLRFTKQSVGFTNIELDAQQRRVRFLKPGMILDFGAIGKGYAADRALDTLRTLGICSALVNIGGDLTLGDPPPENPDGWSVEVHTGHDTLWKTRLHSVSIATSGDSERFYLHEGVRYSHIIHPKTGMGITNQPSVTVIAGDGATADAAASIVSVLGESGVQLLKQEYKDIRIYHSVIE